MSLQETLSDKQFRSSPPSGAMEALGRVFDELAPSLLALALHITKCPELAEDMVQEVFLEELAEGRHLGSDAPIAGRLTERLAQRLDSFKPQGRNEPRVLGLEEATALLQHWTPLSEAQQSETLEQLSAAIDLLPETYKEVVRLSLMEGRNSQEIGIQLRRSPATVRSQLARGLDRLRHSLPPALGAMFLCASTGQSHAAPLAPTEVLHAVRSRFLTQAARARGLHSIPAGTTFAMAVALLIVGLGVGFWLSTMPDEALPPARTLDQASASWQARPTPQSLRAPTVETSSLRELPATETLASAGARAHVFGKVVGPDSKGIEGAEVTLYAWNEWDSSEGAPAFLDERTFGWRQKTNRAGDYSFDVQIPKSARPNLRVEAGHDYTVLNTPFGAPYCNQAPLLQGENKLAPMQLQFAGSLSGTLLTDTGLPAFPAYIIITPGANSRANLIDGTMVATDRDGVFHVDNVVAGQQELVVQYEGQVRAKESAWVNRGEARKMKGLRMPRASTLQVMVTDMDGVPLQGAILRVAQTEVGSNSDSVDMGVRTDDQGKGTVRVLDYRRSELVISLDGYASEQPSYLPEPNQTLLKVRMKQGWRQTFRAVDARTGNTLTNFALASKTKVNGRWVGSRSMGSEPLDDTGTRAISTLDGARVEVQCLGYESKILDPRASVGGTVVVPLRPLRKIMGRVVFNGRPIPMAKIELAGGVVRNGSDSSPDELRTNYSSFDTTMTWRQADPNGLFRLFSFSKPGLTYRLIAQTEDDLAVEHWFTLEEFAGDNVDLGDLELQASGSVEVSLQTPAGMVSGGMMFLLDLPNGTAVGAPDPNGVFTINAIVPGKHTLLLRRHPAFSVETPPFEFSVAAGQTTEFSIDLRPFALSHQDLRLFDNGTPLADCTVFFHPGAPRTQGNPTDWEGGYFGVTDRNGRVSGKAPAAGVAEVWVLKSGQEKRLVETQVDLTPQKSDPIVINL